MKFINDYPYTNMTAQNIDWLIKAVVDLIHEGKTDEEIKNAPGISEAYGAFCNAYPYTNMTMQNIDWLISSVRELYDKEATLEENVVKIEEQIKTLQADVDNIVDKLGDKVDKLNVKNNVYVTDGSTPPKTTGIAYSELPVEGTIPFRDGIGSLQVPTAQDTTQAVNKGQMDSALNGKVDKTTEHFIFYGTDGNGEPYYYRQDAKDPTKWSVPIRNGNGSLVAAAAQQGDEVVNLTQMDTALQDKAFKITNPARVYATDANGSQTGIKYDAAKATPHTMAFRGNDGILKVGTPTANDDATTKKYVDDAIKTAPGWVRVIDEAFTEDVATTTAGYSISIPTEYQKPITELRLRYYMNTPQAGAIFSSTMQAAVVDTAQNPCSIAHVAINKLIDKDKTDITVNFQSVTNKNATVLSNGISDLYNDCYGIFLYKDASGNAVEPIPTDPTILLNTSKIIGTAQTGQDTTEYVLNSCLPNRSHSYTPNSTQTAVNYTSNDYYNDGLPDFIISQVLTSTDTTNLPVGSFICVQRSDLKFALNISISFSSTTAISYKQVFTVHADIIDESIQSTYSGLTLKNTLTSFDSRIGVETLNGNSAVTYYCGTFKDGTPTAIRLFVPSSTSNGETGRKIYAGSRILLDVKY